jgi:NADH-quinone oxidoreductase E subunit
MARLGPDFLQRATATIGLYPQPRSALIPLLHLAQEQDGYLTQDGLAHVAELVGITPAEAYGTASFYDMLFLEPVGKHLVSICTNVACMLNGGYELLEHAESSLGVTAGGTTADGQFTLEEVECIALCGEAPCLAVNWRFRGKVTNESFDQLVADLRAGRLADEIPPHGTLCRVQRTVGLPAGVPLEGRIAPPPEAAAQPTPQPPPVEKGDQGESKPASDDSTAAAAATAVVTENPAASDTAPAADGGEPQAPARPDGGGD